MKLTGKHSLTLILFAVFAVLFLIFAPNRYLISAGTNFFLNVILITGLMLVMGLAGQISLGHAALYGIGAYTSAILTAQYGLPFLVGFVAAGLVAGVFSFLIGLPSLRLRGHYLAMATLGFGEIIFVLMVELDELTGGTSGITGIPAASIAGISFKDPLLYYPLVLVVTLLFLIFLVVFLNSRYARALKAVKSSETAAQVLGLNVPVLKLMAFVIAGSMAGFAGSLFAHLNRFVSPYSFTLSFSIILVAMVVIGGEESLGGNILAALLLTLLNEFLRAYQEYNPLIFGLALVLVIIFAPEGLGGLRKLIPGSGKQLENNNS